LSIISSMARLAAVRARARRPASGDVDASRSGDTGRRAAAVTPPRAVHARARATRAAARRADRDAA